MERIINEKSLKEDVIEGITNYLDINIDKIEQFITDDEIENIIDQMFEAESEEIVYLAESIKKKLKNDS